MQTLTARTTRDRQRSKECRLKQDILGFIVHARMLTTKDTGHRQRFIMIGNNQRIFFQLGFCAIKQRQRFIFLRHTHHDTAVDTAQIEGVHRLTEFQQHVVSDIHHGINRTSAATTQFFTHPQWRWRFNINAFDHTA